MAAGLPTSVAVEVNFSGSTWTAITSSVRSWRITQGSDSGPQPGTLEVVIDNGADGAFTPDNPTSTYYPNFVEGKAIRVTVVKGAATSTRFYGWISNITPTYPSELVTSTVTVTAVDLLGVWQRTQMKHYPRASVEPQAGVTGYYPLTEKNARGGGGDVKGALADFVVRVVSTGGSCDFASDDSFSVDTDPCVTMTSGRGLWHSSPAFSTGSSFSIGGLFRVRAGSAGTVMRLYGDTADVVVSWDGTSVISVNDLGLGVTSFTDVSPDTWHFIRVGRSSGAALVGLVDAVTASLSPGSNTITFSRVALGGDLTLSARDISISAFNGSSFSDNYTRAGLGLLNTLALISAQDLVFSWTSSPTVNATSTAVGGLSKFDAVKVAADSQTGRMWVAYTSTTSTVTVETDADQKPITVALTVDADADTVDSPQIARGLQDKVDTVTVNTPIGSTTVTSGTAGNFGSTTIEVDTFLKDANDQYAKATSYIAASNSLTSRLASVTVDLVTAANDLYSSFFNLTIGERLRLSNLPSAYFGRTYLDGYVEGWEEECDAEAYRVTFYTSPADAPPEAIADNTGGYATVPFGDSIATGPTATSSATSIAITWTGSQTLSTSAGDYPLDLDWNGERVTVTSAPAGSTSPQTVTVTRGVAPTVARAHTVGEPIDLWLGARAAL